MYLKNILKRNLFLGVSDTCDKAGIVFGVGVLRSSNPGVSCFRNEPAPKETRFSNQGASAVSYGLMPGAGPARGAGTRREYVAVDSRAAVPAADGRGPSYRSELNWTPLHQGAGFSRSTAAPLERGQGRG